MLQTCIAKGNGIELLQASCTAITRYLLALSCKCCSSRRFPFQLVQVKRTLPAPHRTKFLDHRGGEGARKIGPIKQHAFTDTLFERIFAEYGPKKLPFGSPYGLQKRTLLAPKSMYKPMRQKI